jgi:hypothetical protein
MLNTNLARSVITMLGTLVASMLVIGGAVAPFA